MINFWLPRCCEQSRLRNVAATVNRKPATLATNRRPVRAGCCAPCTSIAREAPGEAQLATLRRRGGRAGRTGPCSGPPFSRQATRRAWSEMWPRAARRFGLSKAEPVSGSAPRTRPSCYAAQRESLSSACAAAPPFVRFLPSGFLWSGVASHPCPRKLVAVTSCYSLARVENATRGPLLRRPRQSRARRVPCAATVGAWEPDVLERAPRH